jgi:hypothetical protein
MSAELTPEDRELLHAPNYAWIITLNPDGSPQASITWVDADDTHVLVNTAYRWISVEGVVEERELGPDADAHIDSLARAYDGEAWTPVEGQQRVRWRVRPTRVVRYGE